jgi:hypothetical protein
MADYHNINDALKYYRFYNAFCENAIDAMEWYLEDYRISSQARSITESRLLTLTFKAHMDKALEAYRLLCGESKCCRKYEIIMRKYINPSGGADGRGKPYTNEELADLFECSVDTIQRDLRQAKRELKILFFGFEPQNHAK